MNNPKPGPAGSPASPAGVPGGAGVDGRDSRWEAHRAQRRRDLIKSARKAVHALGSDASMEDIAAAAGTSKSVFYRYFGDKAGLQQAMGEVVLGQMQRRIQEAAQAAQTPREGLLAMVSAYLQMAGTSPNVYAFVTRPSGGPDGTNEPGASGGLMAASGALGHFFAAISDMIARPMRSHLGAGPGKDAVIGYWPNAAIGLVRNAGEQWLASPGSAGRPDQAAMARQITDWLCFGIAPDLENAPASGPADARPGIPGLQPQQLQPQQLEHLLPEPTEEST